MGKESLRASEHHLFQFTFLVRIGAPTQVICELSIA